MLFERWSEIPALRMIRATAQAIRQRADRIRAAILEGRSVAGGGSAPEQSLPTWLLAVPGDAMAREQALRASQPPVIGRIEDDRLVLDLRTVLEEEEDLLTRALRGLGAL